MASFEVSWRVVAVVVLSRTTNKCGVKIHETKLSTKQTAV